MGKFDECLICCDYDDTLAFNNRVSEKNIKAINYLHSEGSKLVVLTGRDYSNTKSFDRELTKDEYLVTNNGTVLYKKDVIQEVFFLDAPIMALLTELLKGELINLFGIYYPDSASFYKITDDYNLDSLNTNCATKIIIRCHTEKHSDMVINIAKAMFGQNCTVLKSSSLNVEIFNKIAGKGQMALKLKKLLQSKMLVCIGDCESDKSMLEIADIRIVPSNATDDVKSIADYIIGNPEEGIMHKVTEIIDCAKK